jgi:hypothetical protein
VPQPVDLTRLEVPRLLQFRHPSLFGAADSPRDFSRHLFLLRSLVVILINRRMPGSKELLIAEHKRLSEEYARMLREAHAGALPCSRSARA